MFYSCARRFVSVTLMTSLLSSSVMPAFAMVTDSDDNNKPAPVATVAKLDLTEGIDDGSDLANAMWTLLNVASTQNPTVAGEILKYLTPQDRSNLNLAMKSEGTEDEDAEKTQDARVYARFKRVGELRQKFAKLKAANTLFNQTEGEFRLSLQKFRKNPQMFAHGAKRVVIEDSAASGDPAGPLFFNRREIMRLDLKKVKNLELNVDDLRGLALFLDQNVSHHATVHLNLAEHVNTELENPTGLDLSDLFDLKRPNQGTSPQFSAIKRIDSLSMSLRLPRTLIAFLQRFHQTFLEEDKSLSQMRISLNRDFSLTDAQIKERSTEVKAPDEEGFRGAGSGAQVFAKAIMDRSSLLQKRVAYIPPQVAVFLNADEEPNDEAYTKLKMALSEYVTIFTRTDIEAGSVPPQEDTIDFDSADVFHAYTIPFAKDLFVPGESVSDRIVLLIGLSKLQPSTLREMLPHAKAMFTPQMGIMDKSRILEFMGDVRPSWRKDFADSANALASTEGVVERLNALGKLYVRKYIKMHFHSFPKRSEPFLDSLENYFSLNLISDSYSLWQIDETLAGVLKMLRSDSRKSHPFNALVPAWRLFSLSDMLSDKLSIYKAFLTYPETAHEQLEPHAKAVMAMKKYTHGPDGIIYPGARSHLLSALASVDPSRLDKAVQSALRLENVTHNYSQLHDNIHDFGKISPERHEDIVRIIEAFEYSPYSYDAYAFIPSAQLADDPSLYDAYAFIPNAQLEDEQPEDEQAEDSYSTKKIAKLFADVSSENIQRAIEAAKAHFGPGDNYEQKQDLIHAFATLPDMSEGERASFDDHVKTLFNYSVCEKAKGGCVEVLGKVPADLRGTLINNIAYAMTDNIRGKEESVDDILFVLSRFPVDQQREAAPLILQLFALDEDSNSNDDDSSQHNDDANVVVNHNNDDDDGDAGVSVSDDSDSSDSDTDSSDDGFSQQNDSVKVVVGHNNNNDDDGDAGVSVSSDSDSSDSDSSDSDSSYSDSSDEDIADTILAKIPSHQWMGVLKKTLASITDEMNMQERFEVFKKVASEMGTASNDDDNELLFQDSEGPEDGPASESSYN